MRKLIQLFVGSTLMGVGIGIAMKAQIGVDPMALFWEGIHLQSGISLGMANLLVSGGLIFMILIVDKRQLGIGTILNSWIVSWAMEMVMMLPIVNESDWSKMVFFSCGLLLLAFGIAYYGHARLGRGAFDGFVFGVASRFQKPIWRIRTICDVCFLMLGLMLGAELCLGPFISMLILGVLIQFFDVRLAQNHENA